MFLSIKPKSLYAIIGTERSEKMLTIICKIAILVVSILFVLNPLSSFSLDYLIFGGGAVILLTNLPSLGSSYKKPVCVFLALSLIIAVKYSVPAASLITGVNSMTGIIAMVAVLQLFTVPIKLGQYDKALQQFLQATYRKESSVYIFLSLISHILGSFMLTGTVPMMFAIFSDPLKNMVHEPKHFTVTAICRGYSLVTLWAPGAINVILALQATGANWLQVAMPAIILTLAGLVTAIFLEVKFRLKDRPLKTTNDRIYELNKDVSKANKQKIITLVLIAFILIILILLLEQAAIVSGTMGVLVAGIIVLICWLPLYLNNPGFLRSLQDYWNQSVAVVPDIASLFLSMGVFTEVIQSTALIDYVKVFLTGSIGFLGSYSFLIIPPMLILFSLVGIHPFISILLLGKMLTAAIQIPQYEVFIALSLLIGAVVSYVVSPFAGNVLTLSKMADCSPKEVAFEWNGLFAVVFLLEGLVLLIFLQIIWG